MYCPNPDCPNLLEHGISAEFRDGVAECSECGHRLEHGDAPLAVVEPEPPGWTRIAVYDVLEAALAAKGLLEAEGFNVQMADKQLGVIAQVPTPVTGTVELYVLAIEAESALHLIRGFSWLDEAPPDEYQRFSLDRDSPRVDPSERFSLDQESARADEYERFSLDQDSAGTDVASRLWRVGIVLMFLAGAYLMLQGR